MVVVVEMVGMRLVVEEEEKDEEEKERDGEVVEGSVRFHH